jgi:hypothetical protein
MFRLHNKNKAINNASKLRKRKINPIVNSRKGCLGNILKSLITYHQRSKIVEPK